MTTDIVSAVSRFLTPEIVGKLATASGLDSTTAGTMALAAVPSILSGLAGVADTPGGARHLANALGEQPTDLLGCIARDFTGLAKPSERGTSLLSSLLGGGPLGLLTSAMSKFAYVEEGSTRTLMGLVTPLIMGVLAHEQRAGGLDTNGLASLLTGQKEKMAAAIPPGLSRLLDANRFLGDRDFTPSPERRTSDSPRAAYVPPRAPPMRRVVAEPMKRTTWPYWVLPLLAFGALFWSMLPRDTDAVTTAPTSVAKPIYLASAPDNWVSIDSAPNQYVNRDIYDRTGQKLGTIKDVLIEPDGKMAAAIVNVGRFLGIGGKDVALPFSALQLEQRDNTPRIVVDATKETLQAAPTFVWRVAPKK